MEIDGAARYHGRDRRLVDPLSDGVAQQHDVLIERLDLALQLDAVDEVDRDRDVFLSQKIEDRI